MTLVPQLESFKNKLKHLFAKKSAWPILFFLLCVLLLGWGARVYHRFLAPQWFEDPFIVYIQPGDSLEKISNNLYAQKLVADPLMFRLYAYSTGKGQKIKAGEFEIQGFVEPRSLLSLLTSTKVKNYPITFIEGTTFDQWLKLLAAAPKLEKTLVGLSRTAFMQALIEAEKQFLEKRRVAQTASSDKAADISVSDFSSFNWRQATDPEGLLFPDTYHYTAGMKDIEIVQKAFHKMLEALEGEWVKRELNLPYANAYEALIMASIIEKETGLAKERAEIAGVFIRRLKKGMRLQTDPTVIYGLGKEFNGNLTRVHLQTPNPFNTYMIEGLPPTPIATASFDAVVAALHPKDGNSIFFVAKGDGSHAFSSTLQEHEQAVRLYQK